MNPVDERKVPASGDADKSPTQPRPLPIPTKTLPLLTCFLAAGAVILIFTYLTVHRRSPEELMVNSARPHYSITYWLEHGYLRTGGVAVRRSAEHPLYFHRSSAGGRLLSAFIVEKLYHTATGRLSWRLLPLHNQVVSLLAAALLGLLGFRVARRFGVIPLHALALGLSVQAVCFTFPDNLALYWETSGRESWLVFVAIFLLLEERALDGRTRSITLAQGVSAFFLTHMEHLAGIFFGASYLLVTVTLGGDRPVLTRLVRVCLLPTVLALGVIAMQLGVARMNAPDIPVVGSSFLFRTGLDGSTAYYIDHLDIAYGRDIAQLNFQHAREHLFQWKWLFFAGTTALLGILVTALRGRVPRIAVVSLVSLLGTYILYAALFSQSFVIHPYLYDVLLFTPLMFALFVIAPSLIESTTGHRGIVVIAAIFLAAWVTMVQMRHYVLRYPLAHEAGISVSGPESLQ